MARGGVPFSQRSFSPRTPERDAPEVAGVPMLLWRDGFRALLEAVLAIEALNSSSGIDQPLLAGVKRMTVRAHFDVKLVHCGTSFKCISTCARYNAAVIFGMDCSFHLSCPWFRQTRYHPKDNHTITRVNASTIQTLAVILGFLLIGHAWAEQAGDYPKAGSASPMATLTPSVSEGFAPSERTNFAPLLELASPGPLRAERAMAAFDRQLIFQHQTLHPEYSPSLERLFEQIAPRNSTLIRAASEYSRTDLPWVEVNETHQLCAEGYPSGNNFYMTTSSECKKPTQLRQLDAYFALKPLSGVAQTSSSVPSVIGTFGGEIKTDTFGFGALIDMAAQMLTQIHGDLAPPWDTAPGAYNHHDVASRERFHREMPTFDDKFHEYFKYDNILDEFDGPGGAYVLFNFVAEIQRDALKKFPDLYKFYGDVAPVLTTQTDVVDTKNDYWMRSGFDRGKVRLTFMVRGGKLTAFDGAYHPVGEPIVLGAPGSGVYHTHTSVRLRRLAMNFGLDNLSFTTYFTRDREVVNFETRMDAVPKVVAPPGIQQGVEFVAGEFMRTLAQGSGGMHTEVSSNAMPDGTIRFTSEVTAEFMYSPTLEFFAKLGDSIADEHDAKVREQERSLSQEFLDAFVRDYNNARPSILALDRDPALIK
jgi:hypothetical protein